MSSNYPRAWQAYQASDTAIVLPTQRQIAPFVPNAVSVNNRSAINIKVGPSPQGPFLNVGLYTQATLPWNYGPSMYVAQLGTGTIQTGDFIEIDFLAVSPDTIGAGTIASYPLQVWNVNTPGGISTSLPVQISSGLTVNGGIVITNPANSGAFEWLVDNSNNLILSRVPVIDPIITVPPGGYPVEFRGKVYPGTPGNANQTASGLYGGTGAPNNAQGSDGDFYFRSDGGAGTSIYHKETGAWVGRA